MTLFWILSAVMIVIALALIAPSLMRRKTMPSIDRSQQNILIARERLAELDEEHGNGNIDDDEYATQRRELEQVLLQDTHDDNKRPVVLNRRRHGRAALSAVVVLVPLVSLLLYRQLGSPMMIDHAPPTPAPTAQQSPHIGSLQQMADKLCNRLEQQTPDDGNGWFLLGRTYMTMKDYPSAVDAFEHSHALLANDPGAMLALADALSMTQQGHIRGRAAGLVEKALTLSPDDTTAMWMGGLAAEENGDYERALTLWNKLLPRFAGAPEEQQQLNNQIARVSMKAGLPIPKNPVLPAIASTETTARAIPVSSSDKQSAGNAVVIVKVSLSPSLQQQASADDSVFVYAKAMRGPRFPLAAVRYKVSDLPLTVTLDDSSAVMPAAKLSDFSQVKIGARISHSGNAIAQNGDLVGELENITVGATEAANIVIDRVY